MIAYRKRENVFKKGESEWRVEPDALVYRDAAGRETRLAWGDVSFVRMQYAPTRLKSERYLFQIAGKRGTKFSFDNMHFAGIADFEERSATYTPFARAVLDKVKEAAPNAAVYLGASPASYVGQVAMVAVAFAALIAVFLTIPVFDSISESSWYKFGVVLVSLPFFVRWVYASFPRKARLDALPDYVLPKAGDAV